MRSTKNGKNLKLLGEAAQTAAHNPSIRIPDSKEVPVIFTKHTPAFQLVNVNFLLINEQLGQVMERFNCCMCEKCTAAVTAEVLRKMPPVMVAVRRKSDEEMVNILAAKHRSEVTKLLTKTVMIVRNNPKH